MNVNLSRAFELSEGVISNGVVDPNTIFKESRSFMPTYSGGLLITEEYYNSLTQVNANRIAKIDYSYTDDFVTGQTITYYESDGISVFKTETFVFSYTDDNISNIEVT